MTAPQLFTRVKCAELKRRKNDNHVLNFVSWSTLQENESEGCKLLDIHIAMYEILLDPHIEGLETRLTKVFIRLDLRLLQNKGDRCKLQEIVKSSETNFDAPLYSHRGQCDFTNKLCKF